MNKVGKAGAIICIIGGAIMTLVGLLMFLSSSTVTFFFNDDVLIIVVLSIFIITFGITNIVLASLLLKNNINRYRIITGIFALVTIFCAWFAFIIPAILMLVAGILLLCGKCESKITEEQAIGIKDTSVVDIITNKNDQQNQVI